ncbi:hypothetical protein [Paracoccus nototheniae]|uniref:hypothetical protein n=1 Tax=Paracoccus nototheniae TaxID=2489002 RepID=UPI001038C5F9|nr:hypothetical protein [Paracoccus nototheniae]
MVTPSHPSISRACCASWGARSAKKDPGLAGGGRLVIDLPQASIGLDDLEILVIRIDRFEPAEHLTADFGLGRKGNRPAGAQKPPEQQRGKAAAAGAKRQDGQAIIGKHLADDRDRAVDIGRQPQQALHVPDLFEVLEEIDLDIKGMQLLEELGGRHAEIVAHRPEGKNAGHRFVMRHTLDRKDRRDDVVGIADRIAMAAHNGRLQSQQLVATRHVARDLPRDPQPEILNVGGQRFKGDLRRLCRRCRNVHCTLKLCVATATLKFRRMTGQDLPADPMRCFSQCLQNMLQPPRLVANILP